MKYINKREKTKKAISDAFVNLYGKNDISQITVSMICEEAHINRSTFYTYYTDIYELRETMEQEILQDVSDMILSKLTDVRTFDPNTIVKVLATYIKDHDGTPLVFIKKSGAELVGIAHELLCSHIINTMGISLTEGQRNEILISMKYHVSGIIALLDFWEQEYPNGDFDSLVSHAAHLANEGPLTVIRKTVL